ncbi:GLPGLI family protein [Lutibacter sp.]
MKNIYRLLIILLTPFLTYAQNYIIEYNHIITFPTNSTEAVYRLETNRNESIYYQLKSNFTDNEGNDVIQANEGVVPFVHKDFLTKKTICNQPIINSIKFIKDELPMQVWSLKDETKKIKSFTCKKAITTFRGRTYTAWYTEEVTMIGGPWKFDGLSGLILTISSDDGILKIEATKIEKKSSIELTKFDVEKEKLISWKEYCDKYQKVIERIKKNIKADSDPDMEYNININLVEDIGL